MKKRVFIILFGMLLSQDYPVLGTSNSFDIMTWNVEHYPKHNQTNSYMVDIINQINIDIIAFQEIENENSFNNLISQLEGDWIGYRSGSPSSTYGELSYAINLDEVNLSAIYTILNEEEYYFAYRSPHVIEIEYQGNPMIIINNHFKCCGDDYLDLNDSWDEEYRRYIASQLLHEYVENNYNNDRVIILGDLNDIITDDFSNNVFLNFIESDDFEFADYEIAYGSSSNWSYPTWPSHIDHIIISDELFSEFSPSNVLTFQIDSYLNGGWNEYDNYISDHRPLFMRLDFEEILYGDMNSDENIDVLDVVVIVNLVLNSQYLENGDMNSDNQLNIMDVVILVNQILNS